MQSKYKCSLFLLPSVVFSSAQAHDFWLSRNTLNRFSVKATLHCEFNWSTQPFGFQTEEG